MTTKESKPKPSESQEAYFHGDTEGIPHLTEKLARMVESSSDTRKKKISYSISPLSQALIKTLSDETGTTQGHMVDLAPFLFGPILDKAMARREGALETLELLSAQIQSSLSAFSAQAPHLAPYTEKLAAMMEELYTMEKEAVESKNHAGVSPESFPNLPAVENTPAPPYFREVEALLGDESPLAEMFQAFKRKEA